MINSPTELRSNGTQSFWFEFGLIHRLAILGLTLVLTAVCGLSQDENATREPIVTARPKARKPENGIRKTRRPQPPNLEAQITVKVDPPDSTVYLDGQQLDTGDPATGLSLGGLKPGPHTLTVRHPPGYAEREQIINLTPGANGSLNITLERLMGNLDIVPSVADSEINLESVDSSQRVQLGPYSGRVNSLALASGTYEITISKSGYQTAHRRITIRPGESIFLEPQLFPLPTPTPTQAPPTAIAPVPSRSMVETAGKYFIMQLHGASGDTVGRVGTINVMLGTHGENTVTGILPGRACQVQFVQLENVAEGSVVEGPGPSNQWAKIVVRVRPKTTKRPIGFAINWTSLEGPSPSPSNMAQAVLVEAVPLQKVRPNIPALARSSHATGTVNVLVAIDVHGNVVSAKAVDGPFLFRSAAEDAARRWKFQPATLGGQPTESTQTIGFAFER